MFEILVIILFCWLFLKMIGLTFKVAWGAAKLIAVILAIIALPVLIVGSGTWGCNITLPFDHFSALKKLPLDEINEIYAAHVKTQRSFKFRVRHVRVLFEYAGASEIFLKRGFEKIGSYGADFNEEHPLCQAVRLELDFVEF